MFTEELIRATLLDRARQRDSAVFRESLHAGEPRRARRRLLRSLLRVRNAPAQSIVPGVDRPAPDGVRLAVDSVVHLHE